MLFLSLGWFLEEYNSFPGIRRFGALLPNKNTFWRDFYILLTSWPIISLTIGFSFQLFWEYHLEVKKYFPHSSLGLGVYLLFVKPVSFLLLPQFVSRLISSLALINKEEMKSVIENNYEALNIFSSDWKRQFSIPLKKVRFESHRLNRIRKKGIKRVLFFYLIHSR